MNWKELLAKAREIAAKAEEEDRDLTGEERDQVAELLEDAKAAKEESEASKKDAELREKIELFSAAFEDKDEAPAKPGKGGTLGEQFVNAPQFKGWMDRIAPSGRVPDSARGLISPPVEFKQLLGRKDLIVGDDDESAGAFVQTDYTGIYEPMGRYALNVLDLISRRQTTSDLVEFVRQTTRVQEADTVAEANVTDYTGATGEVKGDKPEGTLEFEKVQAAVKTIAVWIPATKRALSDASQIRGIIDQELRDDLMEELEDQILNGGGVGEDFTGIFNTAGVLEQAWDTDIFTTARNAITYLQVTGRATPTAWVLHPEDWETVELTQDGNDRYYYAGPQARGPQVLWGIPVVTSQSLTQGTGLLGDFRKAILWDREAASIQVSDSHSDFFIRNMVAILAEMRAAFGLIRPSGFVEVAFEAGS
ncbi:MAG: phage major capsid protein [Anaerolineae bacterium]